jgi:protein-L-isoaspartate O-methyltransferase
MAGSCDCPYWGNSVASYIPALLLEQIKPGGKMVIPIYRHQELTLVVKDADGKVDTLSSPGVAFVRLQVERA